MDSFFIGWRVEYNRKNSPSTYSSNFVVNFVLPLCESPKFVPRHQPWHMWSIPAGSLGTSIIISLYWIVVLSTSDWLLLLNRWNFIYEISLSIQIVICKKCGTWPIIDNRLCLLMKEPLSFTHNWFQVIWSLKSYTWVTPYGPQSSISVCHRLCWSFRAHSNLTTVFGLLRKLRFLVPFPLS